jgi:spore coat protein U-like protein
MGVRVNISSILVLIGIILHVAVGTGNAACTFRTAATPLNFGALSPANNTDVIATSTVTIRCTRPPACPGNNCAYAMTDNNGLYYGGTPPSQRMRNATVPTEFLPYEFTYIAAGTVRRNVNTVFTFTGTVRASSYQDAYVGAYSDAVTVTINP